MKMRVGTHRIITIRYQMRNREGELLLDTMEGDPVKFKYGCGDILPGLEQPLAGMSIGERKSFMLSEGDTPGLGNDYSFNVLIEDIAWTTDDEVIDHSPQPSCGTDCEC